MTFLAVDPGIDTGWAVLSAMGELLACGLGEDFPTLAIRAAVIERPEIYRSAHMKGDPNDIVTLAIRVGEYKQRLQTAGAKVGLVLPKTWKGQVPKGIHHSRIEEGLTYAERLRMVPWPRTSKGDGKAGNVWDAVGLAKWSFAHCRFA